MDNVQGVAESALLVFGGIAPEVDPPSLPAGSAAVATDIDFTVASARTRDGLANIYSYAGNFFLGTADSGISVSTDPAEVPWSNPDNISFNVPGTYASVSLNATPSSFAVVQFDGDTYSSSPMVLPVDSPVTLGNVLMIAIIVNAVATVSSVVSALGNTFTKLQSLAVPSSVDAPTRDLEIWAAPVTVAGSETITATFTGGPGPQPGMKYWEFAGLQGSSIDGSPVTTTGSGSSAPAGPLTTANANDAIFIFEVSDQLPTGLPAGYSELDPFSAPDYCYQLVSSTGTYSTSFAFSTPSDYGTIMFAWPLASGSAGTNLSELLKATAFTMAIPSTSQLTGIQVLVNGKQSTLAGDTILTLLPLTLNEPATPRVFQLPTSDGTFTLGSPTDQWNEFWTRTEIESPLFGFSIQASALDGTPVTFDVSGVQIKAWYTPPTVGNFNFVGSFEMTNGEVLTLALDDSGVFWQENLETTPDVLTPFYISIEPDTFADMSVQDDRAFIALSDLQNGTDMPRGYNGQWVDRLSQVGPGIAPAFSATSTSYTIATITQPAAVVNGGTGNPIRAILWSPGAGTKHSAGNIITIEYTTNPPNMPDPNLQAGGGVVLSGFDLVNGQNPNGSYVIISVQVTDTGNSPRNSFSVQALSSQNAYVDPPTGAAYQVSLATITLSEPAPGVQVGTQILVAGASPSAWNNTWTILTALNAAQLQITATSLTSNIATYDFTLISGTAPTTGQQVTITGTTNGGGIFNVVNGIVASVSPTSFTLAIDSPDIAAAAEPTGQAVVNGTEFQFDPGPTFLGATPQTPSSPFIIGNDTGGTVVQPGQLGSGTRMGTVLFLTRNGFLTAPAPPATFTLNAGANSIVVSNIPLGPPNVIARVIALTGADGAFFFWIPTPVTVTDNGQQVTYNATIINDNVTTQATLFITDAVLLAGLSIDTDGSNNFAQVELGSSIGLVSYSQRLFAWGEQNKVQNFNNLSFDGGYLANNPSSPLVPAGWTVDATNGSGGTLIVSPLFGNGYYIQNLTGSTQALYGMIEQSAYQDYNKVAILNPQTTYGVRVTASSPSGAASGDLVVDLFSPSFGVAFGTASIPLSSLTPTMQIPTLNLLTTAFTTQVPSDLLLRVYASAIPNNGDVEIDRVEVYDLAQPVLSTQLRGSYFNNFEAFDGVTGNLGVAAENQQPVRNAFELFDNLYIVKTKSFVSTSDNGTTEPNFWNVREVSNKVGTPSIYGVDVGEGWALIAGQAGLYVFSGGDPIKISPEIDPLWRTINWQYGYTLWLRNDTINRKILIGVPLPTPNQWMPNFPANANPTQPNVVLCCNYKELMTSGALASEGPLRVAYTGELKSFPLGRKWSAWSIQACYADFIARPDTTEPVFFCGDQKTGKIYQQLANNYADDGAAMHCQYVTYPFPKTQEAQQQQMGMHQLLAHFMSLLVIGEGNLRPTIYPDSIDSPDQEALFPEVLLDPPPYGDVEFPLNTEGNRFFIGLKVQDAGEWFDISRIVMGIGPNPWAPTRGSNG